MIGKDEFTVDKRVPKAYIARLCLRYGGMFLRGRIRSALHRNMSGSLIGRRVHILCPKNLRLGKAVRLSENVYIDALSTDGVIIGDGVLLGRNDRIECTGSIKSIGKGITIGARTTFGPDCYFGAAGGINIGSDVIAGQNIRFHSENHMFDRADIPIRLQGVTHKGVVVGNDCWIGAGAVFLDGARVGNGCVVAANAVVTKQFPDNVVLGGIPARILKSRL